MSFDNPFFLFFSVLFNSSFISFGLLHTLSLSLLCSLLLEYKFTRETRKSFDSGQKKTWDGEIGGFSGIPRPNLDSIYEKRTPSVAES